MRDFIDIILGLALFVFLSAIAIGASFIVYKEIAKELAIGICS